MKKIFQLMKNFRLYCYQNTLQLLKYQINCLQTNRYYVLLEIMGNERCLNNLLGIQILLLFIIDCIENCNNVLSLDSQYYLQEMKEFQINLIEGVDFWNIEMNIETLYTNFHPVYYMSDFWGIKVKHEDRSDNQFKLQFQMINFLQKDKTKRKCTAIQISRNIGKNDQKIIQYEFMDNENPHKKAKIGATFSKNQQHRCINITISDVDLWFSGQYEQLFKEKKQHRRGTRSGLKLKSGKKQIQYFYKEAEDRRHFQIKDTHYSIALQGGGVKGISYIGVNSALIGEHTPKVIKQIKNIIGSSAGGILGLAFCCGLQQQQFLKIVKQLGQVPRLDKMPESQSQQYYIILLKEILIKYGIIEPELISVLVDILEDQNFMKNLIELLKLYNSQVGGLFLKYQNNKQKITLSNLLEANLMKGEKISEIACQCLGKVFNNRSKEQLDKINFKELYEETGKQFTCTSVDLKDEIIRFFNHKTTPDMPVAKAVQMTGSFPVAFKSQSWNQKWGKYYIHYDSTRRQKDLTGNDFTDGGVLSNFPIKYLDNDYMRPMYFSHKRTEKTKLYGFGLYPVKDAQYQEKMDKLIKEKFGVLKPSLISIFICKCKLCPTLCGIISSWCKNIFGCVSKTTNLSSNQPSQKSVGQEENSRIIPVGNNSQNDLLEQLKSIPLFKFLIRLLGTFVNSDINFQKQCFEEQSYQTNFHGLGNTQVETRNWLKPYVHNIYSQSINKIIDKTKKMLPTKDKDQKKMLNQIKSNVESNLKYLRQYLQIRHMQFEEDNILFVSRRLNSLASSIYSKFQEMPASKEWRDFEEELLKIMDELDEMAYETYFMRQNKVKDYEALLKLIKLLENKTNQIMLKKDFKDALKKLYQTEAQTSTILLKNIQHYEVVLGKNSGRKNFVSIPGSSIITWINLGTLNFIVKYEQVEARFRQVSSLQVPQLSIARYAAKKRDYITSYAHRMMRKSLLHTQNQNQNQNSIKKNNIHITLESKNISEFYFDSYYPYIEEAIYEFNQNYITNPQDNFKIKTITASGYQSIAAFLMVSSLSKLKINEYLWKIRYTIAGNPNISKNFSKYEWTQTNQKLILQIQQQSWKNKFDIFDDLKQKLSNNDRQAINDYETKIFQLNNSKQQINAAFEAVIHYSMDIIDEIRDDELGTFQQRLQNAKKKLGLKGEYDYFKKLKQANQKSKEFYEMMVGRFQDLIRYSVSISPNMIHPILEHIHDPQIQKEAWKGVILSQTLISLELKSLIKCILIQVGLSYDATLLEFYSSVKAEDRVGVNLLAVQSINKRLIVINHHTRPNMPVWAAIMATSSLPYMFQPIPDFISWRKQGINQKTNVVNQYFEQKSSRKQQYLQSGNNLSRFPLQLITNRKIKKLIGSPDNQTYLSFTFGDLYTPDKTKQLIKLSMNRMTLKPMDRYTVVSIYLRYKDYLKDIFGISSIQARLNQLQIYLSSQDNTFLNAYQSESIQLPIKLGTLDFHRVNQIDKQDGNKIKISNIAMECIHEAENVTRQKINNNEKIYEDNKDSQNNNRCIYFKLKKQKIPQKKEDQLVFQFPSATINNYFDITQRYKIFYEITLEQEPRMVSIILDEQQNKYKQCKQIKKQKIVILIDTIKKMKAEKQEQQKNKQYKIFLNLKIAYTAKIKNIKQNQSMNKDEDDQTYQIQHVYQQFNIDEFFQMPGPYAFMFKLYYDKYYGKHDKLELDSIPFGNNSQKTVALKIQSFNSLNWPQSGLCLNCGDIMKSLVNSGLKVYDKCSNMKCPKDSRLAYFCQKCSFKYCVACKFSVKFTKIGIFCPLDHPIKQKNFQKLMKDKKKIHVRICDSCKTFRQNLYHDHQCNISLCDLCLTRQKLSR